MTKLAAPAASPRILIVHSKDTKVTIPKIPGVVRVDECCIESRQDWLEFNVENPETGFDAIFYLHALPSGIAVEELLKGVASFLKPEGLLYIDMAHGVWKEIIDPVVRLLELFEVRNPKDAHQIFTDLAQTHSAQHEAFQAAREVLRQSPLLFTQLYLTAGYMALNHQTITRGWPSLGLFFEQWMEPSIWETPPFQDHRLLADWKTLSCSDRIDLIEQTVSPRLQAWFRYRPEPGHNAFSQQEALPEPARPDLPGAKVAADTSGQVASLYNVTPYPSVKQFNVFEDNIHYVNLLTGRCFKDPLPGNLRILVAGCGTIQGGITGRSFPEAQVLAIDIADHSLAIARKLADDLQVTNVAFRKMDLSQLERLEGGFDLIIATGVLHHLQDPGKALQDLTSKLANGGIMHLMVYNTELRRHARHAQAITRKFPWSEKEKVDRALLLFQELSRQNGLFQPCALKALQVAATDRASFADTFLHPQERSFTIPELYHWLDQAGLQPSGFIRPYEWTLDDVVSSHWVLDKFRKMPERSRHEAVNLLTPPWMEFFAERKGRPATHRLVEENPETLLNAIPQKRSVLMFEYSQEEMGFQRSSICPTFQNEPGQKDSLRFFFGYEHIFTVAHKIVKDFYDLIDGQANIKTIAGLAGEKYGLPHDQVIPFAIDIFRRFLFRQQMVTLKENL